MLAPRGKILDREGRIIVDNYPSFSALLLRDSSPRSGCRRRSDRAGPASRCQRSARPHSPLRFDAAVPADFSERRHHSRRTAFIEAHRNELPELDTIMAHRRLYPAQRIHGAPDRLRRRSQRRHAEPAAVRALQRRRRGRNFRRRAPVQHAADGPERIAPGAGRQPRPRSRTPRRNRSRARQATQADRRYRFADCRRRSSRRKEWRHRRHGPAHRRNSCHGERPHFRSQRFRGARLARSMEQAGHRSRQAAAEQSHSGAARARLDVQDHHVGRGMAGRHCAELCT